MHRRSLLALATLVAVAACGEPGPTPDGAAAGGPDGTLVVAWSSDVNSLISVVATGVGDATVIGASTFPMLDLAFDCSLKKTPGYATDWSWSDDGKILRMTLRDDLTWSDGTKVTPEDLAFTYDLVGDPAVASPRANYVTRMVPGARPKIIDPTHIEWHFTEAYDRDTQTSHVSLPMVPKHALANADRGSLKGNEFSRNPIVNGPFRVAAIEPKVRIVLEPNDKYTGPAEYKAQLKRVILKIMPDYNTRLMELEKGDVHVMDGVRVNHVEKLKASNPNLQFYRSGYRRMDYLVYNLKNPLFADPNVRVALAHAANVDELIQSLLTTTDGEKYGRQSIGSITPELCGVVPEDLQPYAYDVALAKKMLADAGWTDTDNDGVVDKGGQKFAFEVMTNNESDRRNLAAIRLQAAFKAVGVQMNISKVDFNQLSDQLRKRDFEAVLGGWSAGLFVDPSDMWHSDEKLPDGTVKKHEFNFSGYSNPKVDALIDQGMATPDPAAAAPIWKEMQKQVYADQPFLFLYWMDEPVALDRKFVGNPNILSPLFQLERWHLAGGAPTP